ncbi:uncharacterized protein PFLUO_LOCUS8008 [Penicillium psychrofluorescens]|uniref:uncharacterized protein n=1 Tax=Penicillium psychrofluorescens TaxID=3158075 RepID=UPI003CCDF271
MAEKRRLPPRERREPAKKRLSEATPAPTPPAQKKKATPKVRPPPPELEKPLPTKIKDSDSLPIIRTRQPTTLSDKEYQSLADSAVLLASLERSKKKWLSDGILVRYYTKPKKTKREQIAQRNPPKESMIKVGPCDVTVGPHLFDAMIYTVKDPNAPPMQYAPQQRPMVHYGPPGSFQQFQPSYPPSAYPQKRPPYSPAPANRPPQGHPTNHAHPSQQRPQLSPQGGQRPPQQNGQPAKPSPDPVIQMLATRAAADPELKALMRVVASSQATQEQLRAFQAHIDELNAIIKAREQREQRQSATPVQQQGSPALSTSGSQPPPSQSGQNTPSDVNPPEKPSQQPVSKAQAPAPSKEPGQKSKSQAPQSASDPKPQETPKPADKPQTPAQTPSTQHLDGKQSVSDSTTVKKEPAAAAPPTASAPASTATSATGSQQQSPAPGTPQGNLQQAGARPGPPYPPQQQAPHSGSAPIQSRPPQYGSPSQYYRPTAPLPPPRVNYKAIVFEFTSPLTPYGSSTSGHAGSGDRYLFPEYSILEWIPTENTVLASFLIVRKVDPTTPFPLETPSETSNSKGKGKSKKGDKKGKGGEKDTNGATAQAPGPSATDTPQKPDAVKPPDNNNTDTKPDPGTPAGDSTTPNEANLKEYWQPVTFRIHASNPKILEPLSRVVKPADEVRKYMNEVMDRAERAPDGFLANRLPREKVDPAVFAEENRGTPVSSPAPGAGASASRSRASLNLRRGSKLAGEESEVDQLPLETEAEEEEEDLMDFYGAPDGLPPMGA